jgi:hypothetical protein
MDGARCEQFMKTFIYRFFFRLRKKIVNKKTRNIVLIPPALQLGGISRPPNPHNEQMFHRYH